MTFTFPTDKTQPYVAENGVTYYWDSDRWRVKTYKKEADSRLPYRLGTDKAARSARSGEPAIELVDAQDNYSNVKFFGVNGIEVESTISGIKVDGHQLIGAGDIDLTAYATIEYSDTEDENLQNQIDELGVTKGKVARYTCSSITGGFASRPGQLAFNSGDPTAVNQISFGTEDSDNVVTKPMADGDIIEFVDAVSNTVSRFKITDASGAPTGVEVEYVSGSNDFNVGEEEQVYIYPQNGAGASKDYVDAQDALRLALTGGTLSGAVVGPAFKGLKASGPVITVGTSSSDIKALIHANGLGEFASGKLNGPLSFQRGKDTPQFKISPNSSDTDYATNIYSLNGGHMRFRTSHTNSEGDHVGSHIILESGSGAPETKIYHVATPTADHMAASKAYVDSKAGGGGGVQLWGGSSPPPSSDRGTLLMTSSNQLYIYTAT